MDMAQVAVTPKMTDRMVRLADELAGLLGITGAARYEVHCGPDGKARNMKVEWNLQLRGR